MPKNYTAYKLDDIIVRIIIPAYDSNTELHHAARINIHGFAKDGVFKIPVSRPAKYLGAGQAMPWTNNQIHTAIKNYSNLNNFLAQELKQLYIDGISEEPST